MTLKMYTFSLEAHKKMWEREKKRENMNMRQEKILLHCGFFLDA